MRPRLACSACLLLGLLPAGSLLAQHHGIILHPGVVHPGIVHPGVVHPDVIGGGGGMGEGMGSGGMGGGQEHIGGSFGDSPSYSSFGYGYGYGRGSYGFYPGYGGYFVAGYRPFGYGYGPLAYGYGLGSFSYTLNGAGPFNLPPVVAPAGALFGPQSIQPMWNAGGVANLGPLDPAEPRRQRKVRVANAAARARAGKMIDVGDRLFGRQKYRDALERYKSAVIQGPDMAEIFLRQGFAEVALGRYEPALRAMRRGLKLQSVWKPDDLRLDKIYGDEKAARTAHLEALAMAVQREPHNAAAVLLLGMELFFDGQVARSGPFFRRAAQLGGNDERLLDGFLAATANAARGPAAGAGGGAPANGPANAAGAPAAKPPDRGPILDL